jgi:tetratricopeptide (TPR) repeat protein
MATYNKRGYKQKKVVEAEISSNEDNIDVEGSTTAEVFNTLDEGANKAEEFVEKNQKYIFIIIGLVALFVLGYLGYNQFVKKPASEMAMNEMYQAQKFFNEAVNGTSKDSLYNLALNGGNGKLGLLDITKEYSGTPAGNLANYYAGMAYLNTKKYEEAITFLQDFNSEDQILAPMAEGAIGDAFAQINQKEDALKHYKNAFKLRKNNFSTPTYLYKAGIIALDLGKSNEAVDFFNTIKNDYPKSTEALTADLFIGKAEALLK